nr:hypothetical protein Iba_chr08eCG8950 [Ipomoea batatas]
MRRSGGGGHGRDSGSSTAVYLPLLSLALKNAFPKPSPMKKVKPRDDRLGCQIRRTRVQRSDLLQADPTLKLE